MLKPKSEFNHNESETSVLPGVGKLPSDTPTPREGEAWQGLKGGAVALPIFPGRIPSDTIKTRVQTDRYYLSLLLEIIVSDNYIY